MPQINNTDRVVSGYKATPGSKKKRGAQRAQSTPWKGMYVKKLTIRFKDWGLNYLSKPFNLLMIRYDLPLLIPLGRKWCHSNKAASVKYIILLVQLRVEIRIKIKQIAQSMQMSSVRLSLTHILYIYCQWMYEVYAQTIKG